MEWTDGPNDGRTSSFGSGLHRDRLPPSAFLRHSFDRGLELEDDVEEEEKGE